MKRVAIVGCGGAGKSVLAQKLGELTGIEVFHLDALLWRPGWVMTPKDEELALQQALVARPTWISTGTTVEPSRSGWRRRTQSCFSTSHVGFASGGW